MKQKLPKHKDLIKPYRVTKGDAFRLQNFDPSNTQGFQLKNKASDLLARDVHRISALQQILVVPGDHKWFARLEVATAIVTVLESLDLALPGAAGKKKRNSTKLATYWNMIIRASTLSYLQGLGLKTTIHKGDVFFATTSIFDHLFNHVLGCDGGDRRKSAANSSKHGRESGAGVL